MQYLYYSILFILLYVYMGLGLTLISCPKELRPYSLFLSPVVGYCYLTLVGWYCYQLDLGGTDVYALPLLLPPLFFLFFALLNRRRHPADPYKLFCKELVAPLLVGVIAFIIISIPFIISTDGLTSMSLGNNDIAESASISRYLKEYSRSETIGFLGQSSAFKNLAEQAFFGDSLSTAFAGSLFSLQPYQLQSMSIQIFFLFSILLIYPLARESFRYNHPAAIGITALYGLSPIMFYTVYHGFHGQIFATSLALFIFFLNLQTIQHCKKFSDYYSYIPWAVLTNWGLSLTYPHMLPFIYVLLTAYLLWVSFLNKSASLALQWISFVIISFAITFALSPYRGTNLVLQFFWAGRAEGGWHIPMFLMWNIFAPVSEHPYFDLMGYNLVISYIFIMILSLVDAYKNDRNLFYLAGSLVIMIWAGYIILSFMGRTHLGLGGYKSYKWLSFFLPIVLLSSMVLLRNLKFAARRLNGNALSLLLAVLIGSTLLSSFYITIRMSKFHRAVSKDMADLKRIEINPLIQSVNILGKDWWNILWENHFLMGKKIYFETTTYGGHNASNLDGQWDLIKISPEKVTPFINIPSEKIIFLNSSYMLKRAIDIKQRLITKYYNDILDRNPEPGGTESWTTEINRIVSLGIDIKEGFIAVGKLFFNSAEYLSLGNTDTAYVLDLYQAFLDRTPSQSEVDSWLAYLAQGVSRNEVLNFFIFSTEFNSYMTGLFGASTARPENNLVNDFYRGILSRLPDMGGVNYWLVLMRTAQCTGPEEVRDLSHQIALGFIQSAEYAARGGTDSQYVEDLYDAILRRGAAPWEINYWVNELNTKTREEVLQGFTDSAEFQTRVTEVIDAGCL